MFLFFSWLEDVIGRDWGMGRGGGNVRASGQTTELPNTGPFSQILNHTVPEPSKVAAVEGAFAIYLFNLR